MEPASVWQYRSFASDRSGGDEQVVNDFTGGTQDLATIVMSADGHFVVVYQSDGLDGDGQGIGVRRFAPDGTPSDEFGANTTKAGNQVPSHGRAACFDPQGNIVVVWNHADSEIRADKFYLPNQGPPLNEFRVNTTPTGDQRDSAVAVNEAGNAVVVWVSTRTDPAEQRDYRPAIRCGWPEGRGRICH